MKTGFDGDSGLVVGTVRGFRRWKLTSHKRLRPLTQLRPWEAGENLAHCTGWGMYLKKHQVASVDCSCGFYAYFSPGADQLSGDVEGIIEGYGRVTVGSKGFRAERAKIVALVVPSFRLHFLVPYLVYLIGWMALDTGPRMAAGRPGYALIFALNVILAVLTTVFLAYLLVNNPSSVFFCKPGLRRALRSHYPGVRFFATRKAMLKAFPLEPLDLSALDREVAA